MKKIIAAILLVLFGATSVMAGNFYRNVSVKQADKLIREHAAKSEIVLLDVRSPGEFSKGFIKGAVNINFWDKAFTESVSKLDKSRTYLVYCASGVRSAGAMKKMKELGFTKIYNMKGGMFAWKAARKEVTKSDE